MAITDPEAINFSNSSVRTGSDIIATLYYETSFLKSLREADGDITTTILLRETHIRGTADLMIRSLQSLGLVDNIWFNVGTGVTMNQKFPNSESESVVDNSPDDGRPPISGADVNRMITQVQELEFWVKDAFFGGAGTATQTDAMFNTMLVVGNDGNFPMQESQAAAFIDNRCGEVVIEYEANLNIKLTQILALAPNPRNPQT